MDIQLGKLGEETTFEYTIIEYNYQVFGSEHITPSGNIRLQYAQNQKYLFKCGISYVTSTIWDDLINVLEDSKTNDLNLIIGSDNYTVRFRPKTIPKKSILGTAEGYIVEFELLEV